MLYREIIAVCSQIHTKHINTLCGQNVELLNVKLAVPIVTTGLYCQLTSQLCVSLSSVLLEQLISHFKPLVDSQQPTVHPCLEPDKANPHSDMPLLGTHFNIPLSIYA